MTKLIGKKAKVQLEKDGVLPERILGTCYENRLNPVALLDRELTICDIQESYPTNKYSDEYFAFKEIGKKRRNFPTTYIFFPSEYFQIAMTNHPLTDIFTD